MARKDHEFFNKLLATFKVEAGEHLSAISSALIALEQAPPPERQTALIESTFREVHSLKGAARAVNAAEIERVCHSFEGIFSALKRTDIPLSPHLFDLLHRAVDALGKSLIATDAQPSQAQGPLIAELVRDLDGATQGALPRTKTDGSEREENSAAFKEEGPTLAAETVLLADTVRVATSRLDSLLLQAEELLSAKLSVRERALALRQVNAMLGTWESQWARIQSHLRTLEQGPKRNGSRNGEGKQTAEVLRLVEFLKSNHSLVEAVEDRVQSLMRAAEQDSRSLGGMVDNLLGDVKKLCMLPFSSLLEIFPKLVRDLSRDQGKEVECVIRGGEVQVDRRILDEMKDPLVHLIRNCVDHGIEKSEERIRKNKPPCGSVILAVSQQNGSKVAIMVRDDGAGIDVSKVRSAAVRLGLVTADEAAGLDEQQVLGFIFRSGISTTPMVTDISGRGLGLAIVQEEVEKLGGTVSVEGSPDVGTEFRIVVPLTLATFRGILIRAAGQLFMLPTTHIERVLRVAREQIRSVENRETITVDDQAVSLVRLVGVLELAREPESEDGERHSPAIVLSWSGKRIAFLVDEVLGEQEVLVKSLGPQLSRVRNIAGATVLGTGKVIPILSVSDLLKSAAHVSPSAPVAVAGEKEARPKQSILVAEDSITARTLLQSILESAGYRVQTAVDGMDAWTALKSADFDVVVSDVDMPRMSGFDLTAKIRADKKLNEMPVVLVTALESRQDRERGIDVGASAYIVKSSFDQSNLLEVIRRLI